MIQQVLTRIGGIGAYGVISVLLFFAVFLGAVVWAMALRRPYLERMSRLPLDADPDDSRPAKSESQSPERHE